MSDGPRIGFGFEKRLERLRVLRAEGDLRDVDVAVRHRHQPQILLAADLPADANLAAAPVGVALDCCPPVLE